MICVSEVVTGWYANLQVANSCDDRSVEKRKISYFVLARNTIQRPNL